MGWQRRRPGFFDDGCEPVLICPVDEDLLCGSLAVKAYRTQATVTWRLGWHTMDSTGDPQRHTAPQRPTPELFTFDRAQHDDVLRQARDRFRAVAGDGPARPWFPA